MSKATDGYPIQLGPDDVAKLLPHGECFRFIDSATVEHEPPKSAEEGHIYTVTSVLTIVDPATLDQFIESESSGRSGRPTWMNSLALILGSHFPGQPVVPGVILAEMMGQVGSVLLRMNGCAVLHDVKSDLDLPEDLGGYIGMFDGFEVSFSRAVVPGDTIEIVFTMNTDDIELGRRGVFSGRANAAIYRDGKETTRIPRLAFKAVPPKPA